MKVYLCCIARRENLYIRDFVSYYKNIGFDKIILCDNNYDGEDNFGDVIQDYINDGVVIVENYRGVHKCQISAYYNSYEKYKNECEWMAFFDIDEFLTLPQHKTVQEYLSQEKFSNIASIHANWEVYGDSGRVLYEEKPVWERFTEPSKKVANMTYEMQVEKETGNFHVKSIIHCGAHISPIAAVAFPHVIGTVNGMVCNEHGEIIKNFYLNENYDYTEAYLKHYATKTAEEYLRKIDVGGADTFRDKEFYYERFFEINERTQEKEDILKGKIK